MPSATRRSLTPESLAMLQTIGNTGSFAAAARATGMVPSALTYRVRQIEESLDVLLFDRSSRQVRWTEAGRELLREGKRVLADLDAVANRVKRIATGWEAQLTIAVDNIIDPPTVFDLCEAFYAVNPPTRLKLRAETLSGTLAALTSGHADLALGVVLEARASTDLEREPLGTVPFVFAVAPQHPLADGPEPLSEQQIRVHRIVAVADSIPDTGGLSFGLMPGQDVFTVSSMAAKVEAQIRGLGCGFLPAALARGHIESGRLVAKRVQRPALDGHFQYAWRRSQVPGEGRALRWWLDRLASPVTRAALLGVRLAAGRRQTV